MTDRTRIGGTLAKRRYHVGVPVGAFAGNFAGAFSSAWVGALAGAALYIGTMAGPAQADTVLCNDSDGLGPVCSVMESYCLPYLDDPTSLKPDALGRVPRAFRRHFEGPLSTHVIGYEETQWPNTLVVFMFDEPACEVLTYGLGYTDLLPAFQQWRAGSGSGFVASSEFEPTSKVSMSRAFAATFLAAPRDDGRVTEITFNWNLTFEGLTRLRVSYQPLRDHTRDMMLKAME